MFYGGTFLQNARKEFEDDQFEMDPEIMIRLLIDGCKALQVRREVEAAEMGGGPDKIARDAKHPEYSKTGG